MISASYAGQVLEVVTAFAPDDAYAYVRQSVHYVRADLVPGACLRLGGITVNDLPTVLPEAGRTLRRMGRESVEVTFARAGQWVIEWPERPRLLVFIDPAGAWEVPSEARCGTEFGIVPDARAAQTGAINAALLALEEAGGGTLALGPGIYRTGTVVLRSGVTLYLHAGAVLQATTDPNDFPLEPEERINRDLPRSLIPGARRRLILAENVQRASIVGRGVICGQGSEWRRLHRQPRLTMNLIRFVDCEEMRVEGVILRDSEFWSVHLLHCREVTFRWTKLVNEIPPRGWDQPINPGSQSIWNNADGINPDSTQRVRIEDCFLHTGDDCVPVKNTATWCSRLADVREVAVRRAVMLSSVTALKIGTETLGDAIEDVVFEDIDIITCSRAIAIDLKDGVTARRIIFRNIRVHVCNRPFDFWILRREDLPGQTRFSRLSEVRLDNIDFRRVHVELRGGGESHVAGLDTAHRVEDVEFRGVSWEGRLLTQLSAPDVLVNEHVSNVRCAP